MKRIDLKDVAKFYGSGDMGVTALDGVTLSIESGEFVMITGRSGCGKTTLLSIMGGLTKPFSGKVFFDRTDIWMLNDQELSLLRSRKIGFVFQFASLIPTLNVMDNLKLPTLFNGRESRNEVDAKCIELLDRVGLSHKSDAYPSQLSGGEQRRVALARSFMNMPAILLADEPTGDLDEKTEIEIMEILRKINDDGTAIVMVTHNPEHSRYSRRWLKMSKGKINE